MQTRLQSLIESGANIAIGYAVAVLSQLLIFPWFGVLLPLQDNLIIGAWFTVISLARSYLLRRGFNWLHQRKPEELSVNDLLLEPKPRLTSKPGGWR
jgi:hypothetical protein